MNHAVQHPELNELLSDLALSATQKKLSYTVAEWCHLRRISRAQFYELEKEGLSPVSYKVGRRRYISADADRAWQSARETQSAA